MAEGFFSLSEEDVPKLMAHHFNLVVAVWVATDLTVEDIAEGASNLVGRQHIQAFSDMLFALGEADDQLKEQFP